MGHRGGQCSDYSMVLTLWCAAELNILSIVQPVRDFATEQEER